VVIGTFNPPQPPAERPRDKRRWKTVAQQRFHTVTLDYSNTAIVYNARLQEINDGSSPRVLLAGDS
jgi:hypothetical protein